MSRKRHRRQAPQHRRTILEVLRRDRGNPVKPVRSLIVLVMLMTVWVFVRYEPVTKPDDADVIVYVSSSCSCYRPWIRDLRRDGLAVSVVQTRDIVKAQAQLGVPREFAACHTAVANNYWIEGHIPAESITTLLNDAPEDVAGLAHLRAEIESGDALVWEVITYDAKGEPISSTLQTQISVERGEGVTHDQ